MLHHSIDADVLFLINVSGRREFAAAQDFLFRPNASMTAGSA
jgi:hypothetical protein